MVSSTSITTTHEFAGNPLATARTDCPARAYTSAYNARRSAEFLNQCNSSGTPSPCTATDTACVAGPPEFPAPGTGSALHPATPAHTQTNATTLISHFPSSIERPAP